MKKSLIVYFSASGVTRMVANELKDVLDGDLFEIVPENKYTSMDLDWTNKNSRSTIEMHDDASRPKILNKLTSIDAYENIFIGYPIWWDLPPRIINTFIEENNLTNKNIYLFATSGGSDMQESFNYLKNKYPNLHFIDGKLLNRYNVDSIKEIIE